MPFEPKDMTGVLFKNEKDNDRQPDFTGNILVNGEKFRLAAWKKEGRSGAFLSLSVSKPEERRHPSMEPF